MVVSEGRPAHDGGGPAGENDTTQCLECMPIQAAQSELGRFSKLGAVKVFPGHLDNPVHALLIFPSGTTLELTNNSPYITRLTASRVS